MASSRGYRTGLFLTVAADGLVGGFRARHHAASVARRLPPHITLLFPFVQASAVDDALRSDLAEFCATLAPFEAELARVGRFDRHVWLAPEPRDRFVELIRATRARFPASGRPERERGDPVPHLTIAAVDAGDSAERVAALARAELEPLLPFGFSVSSVSLLEEGTDGFWHELGRFGLG